MLSRNRPLKRGVTTICLALAGLGSSVQAQGQEPEPERTGPAGRVRDIRIVSENVFTEAQADGNLLFWIANTLHFPTQERVIRREFWFEPGDEVRWEEIAELERNVRALDFFGEVHATAEPVGDDQLDVTVDTRDRFTLAASASISHVGGVSKLDTRLSESNLFGSGKGLSASAKYADDEHVSSLSYWDPQLAGTWHTLGAHIGETDEGYFVDVQIHRPFRNLGDPLSYGFDTGHVKEAVDRYRDGSSVAEVPLERHELRFFGALASGPREERTAVGMDMRFGTAVYGPAFGSQAGAVRVPGDTSQFELGPYVTYDYRPRFETVTGLDTIDYTQDLALGVGLYGRLAGRYRDEENAGAEIQPVLDLRVRAAVQPFPDTFFTFEGSSLARWGESGRVGHAAGIALHAYQTSLPAQTLAGSFTYDISDERQDLDLELTLGEDNGLRGYPAREFTGTRIARLNLEDRLLTGIEFWSMHVGLAAFCDVGWVHDPLSGLSFGDPMASAGFGLRLGSSQLLGSRVLRVDFAWPLSTVDGEDYGFSVSFATGQVFSFFGNASELGGF